MSNSDIVKLTKSSKTHNLLCDMKFSDFGKIKSIITKTFTQDEINSEYVLPKILVIGGESTGKSSVLENITKCHIFPRNSKVCTKSPIRIILNDGEPNYSVTISGQTTVLKKNEIYEYIKTHFEKLNKICDEEITVRISDKGFINMELFDLPGIATYPPDKELMTKSLVRKYLQEDNSIIICTVPATETRLVNQTSISLIKECKCETDTIVVFTMIDRIQDDYLDEFIYDRLTGNNDELAMMQLTSCVGVQNRSHKDSITLTEADTNEGNHIQYILDLLDTSNEYKKYKKHKAMLEDSLGIEKLIDIINQKYMSYISMVWIPKIITKLLELIGKIDAKVNAIGATFPVDILSPLVKKVANTPCDLYADVVRKEFIKKHDSLCITLNPSKDIANISKYVECLDKLFPSICTIIVDTILSTKEFEFNKTKYTNLQLSRFPTLYNKLYMAILECLNDNYSALKSSMIYLITYYHIKLIEDHDHEGIRNYIFKFINRYMLQPPKGITSTFTEFDLVESEDIVKLRAEYDEQLKNINKNISTLSKYQIN